MRWRLRRKNMKRGTFPRRTISSFRSMRSRNGLRFTGRRDRSDCFLRLRTAMKKNMMAHNASANKITVDIEFSASEKLAPRLGEFLQTRQGHFFEKVLHG